MVTDILTVIWKEWKDVLNFRYSGRSGLFGLLITIGIFSIVMPLQAGNLWIETPLPLATWMMVPVLLIGSLVVDSFAGERERHTLETLLASRLPDQAVLAGKIISSVSYVWILTQVAFLVALIPVNIRYASEGVRFYQPKIYLSGIVLSLLVALLMGCIGVLVSLKASTVKAAQQTLYIATFVVSYGIPMAGVYALRFVPKALRDRWLQPLIDGKIDILVVVVGVVLLVLIAVFYALARNRFRRVELLWEG